MSKYSKITPEGTRDLLFEECEVRNGVINNVRTIFENKGYREVKTPGFEFYDVFSSNSDYYPHDNMFRLTDNRGRLLTMRPDSTIPIARMTATKLRGLPLPLRLYYAQHVFRRHQEMKGKHCEMMQMGVELIGSSTFESDTEVLVTAMEALKACSSTTFRIELGHVGIFSQLMSGIQAEKQEKERIHRHIASKNYAALDDVLEGFKFDRTIEILRELPKLFGGREVLEKAERLFKGYDSHSSEMLEYLGNIFDFLTLLDQKDRIIIDFGLVNQAEYYSSLVFKGYISTSGEPILSGGRYDRLFRDYGEDWPATGFGLNVDALSEAILDVDSKVKAYTSNVGINATPETEADSTASEDADNDAGESIGLRGDKLRIALTKGRLEKEVLPMFTRGGYDMSCIRDKGRKLLIPVTGTDIEIVFVKATDVITYVEHGVCDVGIVGKDIIAEQGGVFYEIMDLGIGKCRFALAAKVASDFYSGYGTKRIATKYPNVAAAWFEGKGMGVEIIKIEGSVELAPLLGLADGIVDIVETGATLRENGLMVIDEIRPISARMIVNIVGMKFKKTLIDELVAKLETAKN